MQNSKSYVVFDASNDAVIVKSVAAILRYIEAATKDSSIHTHYKALCQELKHTTHVIVYHTQSGKQFEILCFHNNTYIDMTYTLHICSR